jgi:DNA-binding transcriptional LysR family regulator
MQGTRMETLSAASKQLGAEHTTVARHINALDGELNSRLFHKSNSGYELTDAGERLLAGADAIESATLARRRPRAAKDEGRMITATVRIGAPDGVWLRLPGGTHRTAPLGQPGYA